MILTIDTEKESPAQLRRIADFLRQLAGESPVVSTPEPVANTEMFSMFSADDSDDEPPAAAPKILPY